MRNRRFLILILLLIAGIGRAEKIIVLTDSISFVEPRENMVDIYEDKEGEKKIQQILSLPANEFPNYSRFYNYDVNNAYWIRFVVDPKFTINNNKWVLEILDS